MDDQERSETTDLGENGNKGKNFLALVLIVLGVGGFVLYMSLQSPRSTVIGEGDAAPDWNLRSVKGAPVSLSQLRGEIVFLNFWATWCAPCLEEMPSMERLYAQFEGRGLKMVAVSVDDDEVAVKNFLSENNITLPILLDPGGKVSRRYGTFKYPETYLIDGRGVVAKKIVGPRNWDDRTLHGVIEALLSG
jgi:peroxiredoxin